jgi:hypothetical protein
MMPRRRNTRLKEKSLQRATTMKISKICHLQLRSRNNSELWNNVANDRSGLKRRYHVFSVFLGDWRSR